MAHSRNSQAEFKKPVSEYENDAAAVRAKTERLRALRLARDAAAPATAAPVKKASRKAKAPTVSLSDWLKDREDGGHKN